MNMKKLIATVALAFGCMMSTAGGLYFVSGGDFRECLIKYVVQTTEPNQEVEVTPYRVRLLSLYDFNSSNFGPWSIRTDGKEVVYSDYDLIRQTYSGSIGNRGCTNAVPYVHTYAKPGNHMVKFYDPKFNVYQMTIMGNNIVSLYCDLRNVTDTKFISNFTTSAFKGEALPNLRSVVLGVPKSKTGQVFNCFGSQSTNLVSCILLNPEAYTYINGRFQNHHSLTNDMIFPNVTNVVYTAFAECWNIRYASFPNIEIMGQGNFNCAGNATPSGAGLRRVRIGDTLRVMGQNCFYYQPALTTVEFVTDAEDWIAAWNNHPILPKVLGTATASEVEGEANMTPITATNEYITGTRWAKPSKLIRIRRTNP